jgi:hypothetical protein
MCCTSLTALELGFEGVGWGGGRRRRRRRRRRRALLQNGTRIESRPHSSFIEKGTMNFQFFVRK